LAAWRDGAIKQWLVERLLAERAAHPDFFAFADYAPLAFDAGIAFARGRGDERLVVYAMTGTEALKRKLVQGDAAPDLARLWGDARLELEPGPWRNLLTGSAFAGEGAATCADAAGGLPWLILGKWHE
jgi:(1->4)-alpha-D-glucan 1-alpha-D-glucosylmutase